MRTIQCRAHALQFIVARVENKTVYPTPPIQPISSETRNSACEKEECDKFKEYFTKNRIVTKKICTMRSKHLFCLATVGAIAMNSLNAMPVPDAIANPLADPAPLPLGSAGVRAAALRSNSQKSRSSQSQRGNATSPVGGTPQKPQPKTTPKAG